MGKQWKQWQTLFWGSPKSLQMGLKPWNQKMLASWKKSYDQPRQYIKKQGHYSANKGPSSQSYGFSSSHIWIWELDHRDAWVPKKWCFSNWGVGEDSWESLGLQGNQSILKEISPEHSLEGLMLKLQYCGHLMWRTDSFDKTLMLGKIEGKRRRELQSIRWLNGITNSMDKS